MAQGLQVFREDGTIQLDMSRKFTKVIGIKELNGDGEMTIDEYPNNDPWYFILAAPSSLDEDHLAVIRLNHEQKKIIWKNCGSARILYGVY